MVEVFNKTGIPGRLGKLIDKILDYAKENGDLESVGDGPLYLTKVEFASLANPNWGKDSRTYDFHFQLEDPATASGGPICVAIMTASSIVTGSNKATSTTKYEISNWVTNKPFGGYEKEEMPPTTP